MPKYAAVDIGSNSLRLEVAEVGPPGTTLRVLAADREITRLGESVFRDGRVSPEAMKLTCGILERMARIYQKLDVTGVRAVATSAIRDARNQVEFLDRAGAAIGTPVEIISGAEESRLIHLGVQSSWPQDGKRVLIIDIGGGSAEIILSESGSLVEAFSKPLGAVRLTELFLKEDPPSATELRRMDEYIDEKISTPLRRIGARSVDRVIGTSATASAVVSAVNRLSGSRNKVDRLRASTRDVSKLFETVSTRKLAGRRKLPGIGPRRAEIIVPGVAVLRRLLQDFKQPSFYYCDAGVRDGIIADLHARGVGHELSLLDKEQRRVVEEVAHRYGVVRSHARHVAELAHALFTGLDSVHELPRPCGKLLQAAALLIDTGHYVSDTRHHRHSYYLVVNSALPGFTDRERAVIANLCRYHRKSLPTTLHPEFEELSVEEKRWVLRLTPLLRLADALDQSRKELVESVECHVRDADVELRLKTSGDIDLEVWSAEQNRDAFRELYGKKLSITRTKR